MQELTKQRTEPGLLQLSLMAVVLGVGHLVSAQGEARTRILR